MGFRETLSNDCPPADAHEGACACAFRFVLTETPTATDFASYAARGKPLPDGIGVCACRWASCSLFLDLETVRKKRKIKSLQKYRFVAELKIAAKSGRMKELYGHIDFWMYDHFDPLSAIVVVKDLDDG
jgi:hypothetical protein